MLWCYITFLIFFGTLASCHYTPTHAALCQAMFSVILLVRVGLKDQNLHNAGKFHPHAIGHL